MGALLAEELIWNSKQLDLRLKLLCGCFSVCLEQLLRFVLGSIFKETQSPREKNLNYLEDVGNGSFNLSSAEFLSVFESCCYFA